MTVEPAFLVVNAKARVGDERFDEARRLLGELGVPLAEALALDEPSRLTAAIEAAVRAGVRRVLVGGGDGSISCAANVLAGSAVALGVLPFGTGNDFARGLRIPVDLRAACEVIARGATRQVDLGRVNGRYFLNAASAGVSTDITKSVKPGLKRRLGKLAYAATAAAEAPKLSPFRARLVTEDQTLELDCAQVVIGNGRYHGGGSVVTPDASLTNARLEIYVIETEPKGSEADPKLGMKNLMMLGRIGLLIRRGRHVDHPAVKQLRARRVSLWTDPELELDVDGELGEHTPAEFEVVPRGLKVIVPA